MQQSSSNLDQPIWVGKPWIIPSLVGRTIVVFVIAAIVVWLEFYFSVASDTFGLPLALWDWTVVIFFLIWVVSIVNLLAIRATHTYILLNDSLMIRAGIVTSNSFTVAASGFGDMEVRQSVGGRLLDYGDIIIRTQTETSPNRRMIKIKNPQNVAAQIREVMARPIVRIEGQQPPPTESKK